MAVKSDYKENLDRVKATFNTNKGKFQVELYAKECPETVWNFINLAEGRQEGTTKEGPYYNGIIFHRIITGFMAQGGCPDGLGVGGPGYQFADEIDPSLKHDSGGILSMANAGPGTNGSQFFITYGPTPHLDGKHTVFGKVVEGMDVVNSFSNVETDHMDKPIENIVIESVEINR